MTTFPRAWPSSIFRPPVGTWRAPSCAGCASRSGSRGDARVAKPRRVAGDAFFTREGRGTEQNSQTRGRRAGGKRARRTRQNSATSGVAGDGFFARIGRPERHKTVKPAASEQEENERAERNITVSTANRTRGGGRRVILPQRAHGTEQNSQTSSQRAGEKRARRTKQNSAKATILGGWPETRLSRAEGRGTKQNSRTRRRRVGEKRARGRRQNSVNGYHPRRAAGDGFFARKGRMERDKTVKPAASELEENERAEQKKIVPAATILGGRPETRLSRPGRVEQDKTVEPAAGGREKNERVEFDKTVSTATILGRRPVTRFRRARANAPFRFTGVCYDDPRVPHLPQTG